MQLPAKVEGGGGGVIRGRGGVKTAGTNGNKGGQRRRCYRIRTSPMLPRTCPSIILNGKREGRRKGAGARGHACVGLLLCVAQLDVHVGVSRVQAASEQCMRQHAAISLASKRVEGGGGCTLVLRPCRRQYHLVHAGRAAVLFRPGSKSPNDAYCANDTVGWVSAATATAKEHARACCR